MKKKATSLKSYLEDHLSSLSSSVPGAKSFTEYVKQINPTYRKKYSSGFNQAALGYKKGLSGYGSNAELLSDRGINGGYAERLNDISLGNFNSAIKKLGEERNEDKGSLIKGYEDYISGLEQDRESLKERIQDKLLKEEIINPKALYSYGVGAGLSENEANEIAENVYNALRLKVMGDILSRVASLSLDPAGAITLATDRGLKTSDVNLVRKKAKQYYTSYADSSYLDYLENIANKTTGTFK